MGFLFLAAVSDPEVCAVFVWKAVNASHGPIGLPNLNGIGPNRIGNDRELRLSHGINVRWGWGPFSSPGTLLTIKLTCCRSVDDQSWVCSTNLERRVLQWMPGLLCADVGRSRPSRWCRKDIKWGECREAFL
jgi:hypothetical protein